MTEKVNNARILQREDGDFELRYDDEAGQEVIAGVDPDPAQLDAALIRLRAELEVKGPA